MKSVIVYSKPNCPYCVRAKTLLDSYSILYTEKVIGVDTTREELLEVAPNARTVPQIIINNDVIGGYEQLSKYIEDTNFNGTGYSL